MNSDAANTAESLRLGIDAARAGQKDQANAYLTVVLEQEPDNIPALFWSAFVASSPQESLRLLEQVLALDPDNERAQAGVRWAQQRLDEEPVASEPEPEKTRPTPAQTTESPAEMPDEFIRDQLLSREDVQKRAKKGALAHRARRTIDPLLIVIIVLAAATVLTLGIWLVAFTPAETLAAWLPVATVRAPDDARNIPAVKFLQATEPASPAQQPVSSFTSQSDTIIFNTPVPEPVIASGEVSPAKVSTLVEETASVLNPAITRPGELVGPANETSAIIPQAEESGQISDLAAASTEAVASTQMEVPAEGEAPIEAVAEQGEQAQPVEESSSENPAVTGSLNELVESADEVLNGPRLFVPVDEGLLAHIPAYDREKWIEVDVTLQRITAWEGNVPVMSFIGSTGLPGTPTVLGEYNIYWKLESTLMAGADYYLPDVPYTMYFYGGYALHGTYWHNNFGQPMSHGCVNLTNDNAKQIFEWADPVLPPGQTQVTSTYDNPGTLVVVHE